MNRVDSRLLIVWPMTLLAGAVASSAEAPEPCRGKAYDLARRFAGTWEEYTVENGRESLEGVLTTSLEANGCALTQTFVSRDRALSFRTLGYVEAGSGQWTETYVLSNGRVATYRWRTADEEIIFDAGSGDSKFSLRYRIRFLNADAYEVIQERAPTGSSEWRTQTRTMTRRVAK
jgi:hypothetical protein